MRPIKKASADQSVVIRIIDSSDGTPETAVEHNSAGIDLWYRREGAVKTSLTEAALAALDSAHSDGGIEHIGDGYYRLDLPDAAVAAGANGVMVGGAVTGMIVIGCYISLVDYDPYDSVRAGLTALPNAAADAAGGLAISDAGGLDLDTKLANTNEVTAARMGALTDWINGGRLDLILDIIAADTTTDIPALIATAQADLDIITGASGVVIQDGSIVAASLGADCITEAKIANNAIAAEHIAAAAIDNATFAADVGSTAHAANMISQAARKGLDDYDPPTKTEMDTGHGLLATEAKQDIIDTVVDAIKAKTDNLPADPASETNVNANETKIDTIDGIVDAILVDTGTTLPAALTTIDNFLDTEIAAILADTNELQVDWTNGGRLDLLIDAIKVVTDALTAAAATKLAASAGTIVSAAAATGTLSTTEMTTNLTEATNDHYNGRIIIWTSGVLQNQATDITDYDGGTKKLTFTAVTEAPSNGDSFVIV